MNFANTATTCRIAVMTGEELKAFREKFDLSQTELADLLKVARNTVSRWEIGASAIPEFLDFALETIERKFLPLEK